MISVNGIILVLSCNKHLNTRLKKFKLNKDNYKNWKVIYVIGDLFLDRDYKLEGDMLIVKCEDSYIHLLKKLVLSLKYIYEIFDIKEGVLRSGDDLTFNEDFLETFLKFPKKINNEDIDFLGKSPTGRSLLSKDISDNDIKISRKDYFMIEYYKNHPEDYDNPLHNLKNIDISKYIVRPHIPIGPAGVLYYISNKACKILINHLDNIKYNIFHYDEYSNSYPYTIEDCAVSFILYYNKISFINYPNMFNNYIDNNDYIAIHTNYLK